MPVTKDGDTSRWMSQIRVTDWTGKTIHKKKRSFATKKEALQWECDFISQSTGSLGMNFGDFIEIVRQRYGTPPQAFHRRQQEMADRPEGNALLQENPTE